MVDDAIPTFAAKWVIVSFQIKKKEIGLKKVNFFLLFYKYKIKFKEILYLNWDPL